MRFFWITSFLALSMIAACDSSSGGGTGTDDDDNGQGGGATGGSGATSSGGSSSGGSGGAGAAGGSGGGATGGSGGGEGGSGGGMGGSGGGMGGSGGGMVPGNWTCEPKYYGGMDGCDCGCGVIDPDCADATVGSCLYCGGTGSCGTGDCPANIDPNDNSVCLPPVCGNSILDTGEGCDDGNTMTGDGCDATCQKEPAPPGWTCNKNYYGDGGCDCGCGALDVDCADATAASCAYCDGTGSCATGSCPANIALAANHTCTDCGNGAVDMGEECDDGNTSPADGCGANCQFEVPAQWTCNPAYYIDGLCDCGCGAFDMNDCADATVGSCAYCDDDGSCGTGMCPANIDPNDNTKCL